MSAPYDYASGSDSDSDDAPEVVSLSTAKSARQDQERRDKEAKELANKARKEKNRAKEQRKQAVKGKGKARQEEEEEDEEDVEEVEEALEEEFEGLEEDEDEDDDLPTIASPPPLVGKKTTYLDDSLFAEAAAHYEPQNTGRAPGQLGKKAMKRLVKEEKRRKRERQEERDAEIREGGKQQAGDITLQHLPGVSTGPAALSSTALPSHTSATKFLASRLYSKKRQVAVLEAGRPVQGAKKQKMKGGMSMESRILLGLEDEEDEGKKKEKEKKKKRGLLLTADGQRKSASSSRPLAAARRGAKPAANFAVSTFRG
ncbi:hypothetical protein JCM6882_006542 [Rhodosporidiobolus microsporus]